jgi:hypothetical protein
MTDRAQQLAERFHETYERLAPQFGYVTRPDTRAFDPSLPNGRLMVAVCAEILAALAQGASDRAEAQQAARSEAPALTDEMIDAAVEAFHARRGSGYREDWRIAIQAALSASPPEAQPAEQRKPLTEKEIGKIMMPGEVRAQGEWACVVYLVRAIERAHGIDKPDG